LNVTNAQNGQLIRDIEKHIAKIDSLRKCCWYCFVWLHTDYENGYSDNIWHFFPLNMPDSILCNDEFRRFHEYAREGKIGSQRLFFRSHFSDYCDCEGKLLWRLITTKYYRMGRLVAVKKQTEDLLTILYINDGKVIYHRGGEADVKSLMQKHNLRF